MSLKNISTKKCGIVDCENMNTSHKIGIYKNLSIIFLKTIVRHGPLVAFQRATNFVVSKRLQNFFIAKATVDPNPIKKIKYKKPQIEAPDILVVTHVWNLSGVPMVATELSNYFSKSGNTSGLWSEESPISSASQLVGFGSFDKLAVSFKRLPQIILLNTSCVSAVFIEKCCEQLALGRVAKLILYSHEDIVILAEETIKLLDIQNNENCHILAGSSKTASKLQHYFKNKQVRTVPYQISSTPRIRKIKKLSQHKEFASLEVLLVGSTADGRKSHIKVAKTISWARRFSKIAETLKLESKTREINITMVGAGLHPQLDRISTRSIDILKRKLTILPMLEEAPYLDVLDKANAVICLSQYETLPLYISEAMARGCIVLRNDCGGLEEQLKQGVNGILLGKSMILNGYKIYNLAKQNDLDLLEMSNQSVAQFESIHNFAWDEEFSYLLRHRSEPN